jgi:membrane protease YdiL (CAAX protease family)
MTGADVAPPAPLQGIGAEVTAASDCEQCGRPVTAGAHYCPGCGALATEHASARPPGWYPDPYERFPFRWWDGTVWTWYAASGDSSVQWDPTSVEDVKPQPPGLRGVGLAVAGYVFGVGLSLAVIAIYAATGHPGGKAAELVASEIGLWFGLLGAVVLVSRRRGTGSLRRDFGLKFRPIDIGLGLAASLVGHVLAGFAVLPVSFLFRHVSHPSQSVIDDLAHGVLGWTVLILVVCVGAPIIEELFFRGLVQVRLIGRWGPVRGITVTAVLFGAAHLIAWQGPVTFAYGVSVFAGGLVLGAARYYSGRLGTSISGHMFFNAQAMLALALSRAAG